MNKEQISEQGLARRRHFPLFGRTLIRFDIEKVREEMVKISLINGWNDMTRDSELVRDLIHGRDRLIEKFQDEDGTYSSYHQILLTEFNQSAVQMDEPDLAGASKFTTYKADSLRSSAKLDESKYNFPRPFLSEMPELSRILAFFGSRLMRARFAKISPGFKIKPHIDYDTTYGIRLHMAVQTNSLAKIFARRSQKDSFEQFHIPADGFLYFVNAGFEHYAGNEGDSDRVHLVLSVLGQQDVETLKLSND